MRASAASVRKLSTFLTATAALAVAASVAPVGLRATSASTLPSAGQAPPTPPALPVGAKYPHAHDASYASVPDASGTQCAYGTPDGGYLATTSTGQVFTFGAATAHGTLAGTALYRPIVGLAATSDGGGYWLVTSGGTIHTFGDAPSYGPAGNLQLSAPIVGMAATPNGKGYWLVGANGAIYNFGDATYFGSAASLRLKSPVVGMAPTPDGNGYTLVASDGGIFSFGDSKFYGSTGGIKLAKPIVGMAATPDGKGYWFVASDGGIFAYGDAKFHGSTGAIKLAKPIVGMAATPDGNGYTLVGGDGATYPFGAATFQGTFSGGLVGSPVTAVAALPASAAPSPAVAEQTIPVSNLTWANYYYAGGQQWAAASGASVQICQSAPRLAGAEHTLTEMAIESRDGRQIIEFISVVEAGSVQPFLWMTWWHNGTFQNTAGFVQVSHTIGEFMPLPAGSTASYAIEQSGGRWNYYYDGNLVGYFPDSLWGGAFNKAGTEQVFGEIATSESTSTAQMGDGILGHDPGSSTVNGYQLFGSNEGAHFADEYYTSDSSYDIGAPEATSFRYGGPGAA